MTPEIINSDSGWPYTKAKTAVLAAAASVLREEGPRAATLKNIASRAGITEPAIFRHFDGVDGLFEGLFSAYERMYGRFAQAYASGETGLARLRVAMAAMAEAIASSHDFAYILLHAEQVFRGYAELRRRVAELKAAEEGLALECVNEGIAAGDIRSDVDPFSIATSAIGVFSIVALSWVESGFAFDLRKECAARWDDIERLISARPSARASARGASQPSAALRSEHPAAKARGKAGKAAPKRAAKPAAKPAVKPVAKLAAKPAAAAGRAKAAPKPRKK